MIVHNNRARRLFARLRKRGAATSLRKAKIDIKLLARDLIEVREYYLGNSAYWVNVVNSVLVFVYILSVRSYVNTQFSLRAAMYCLLNYLSIYLSIYLLDVVAPRGAVFVLPAECNVERSTCRIFPATCKAGLEFLKELFCFQGAGATRSSIPGLQN